ncbi:MULTISPECIES: hypothetical protein [Alphaproteobacteria]|jgi:hypothetical protein|uniref:hypothetical protein n=1 Tax=Alphaproteobacteria TaxID=28211 RepID=UPI00329776F5
MSVNEIPLAGLLRFGWLRQHSFQRIVEDIHRASFVWRVRSGFTRGSANDRDLLSRLIDAPPDFASNILSRVNTEPNAVRREMYDEILDLVEMTSLVITKAFGRDSAATIKLLWSATDGEVVVRTLARDAQSRSKREHLQPPNFFPVSCNTAFERIACQPDHGRYFASDNLKALELRGHYKNNNDMWPQQYNATAVVGIPYTTDAGELLSGFLCVDSRTGPLSDNKTRLILELVSARVHNLFSLVLFVEMKSQGLLDLEDFQNFRGRVGWRCEDQRLVVDDSHHQMVFQAAIDRLEQSHEVYDTSQHRVAPDGPLERDGLQVSPANAEAMAMKASDPFYADLLSDEDIDPQRAKVLQRAGKISDREFVSILEKISPGNPYAEGLLKAAKDKKIG